MEQTDDSKEKQGLTVWSAMPVEFWRIAYLVLVIFLVVMFMILMGCWALLSGRVGSESGPALAAVAGLVGAIAGYAAANVSTVLSTIYGGSMTQHGRGADPKPPASDAPVDGRTGL